MDSTWDCIVVGAGAAGLSAALVLGRARRRTLVVDAGAQSNRRAHGIGGLLGHDGRPPADLYAAGRAELAAYPGPRRTGSRRSGRAPDRAASAPRGGRARCAGCRRLCIPRVLKLRHPERAGSAGDGSHPGVGVGERGRLPRRGVAV